MLCQYVITQSKQAFVDISQINHQKYTNKIGYDLSNQDYHQLDFVVDLVICIAGQSCIELSFETKKSVTNLMLQPMDQIF